MVKGRDIQGPHPSLRTVIVGYDIPCEVEDKMRRRHGVHPREATQVIESADALWFQDTARAENEWCILGPTKAGRWLRVHGCIYEEEPLRGYFRVFTAFEMTDEWHELYRRHNKKKG